MNCPFCERVQRNEYDTLDQGVVSFEPLNPVAPGHRLFLPVVHVRHHEHNGPHWAGRCVQAALEHRQDSACNIITSIGRDATQTVPHLHIHYVPRRLDDGLKLPWSGG